MGQKIKGKTAALKFLVCALFVFLISETAFAQVPGLTLNLRTDIRFETVCSYNTVVGYNLYVRKKPGMESVMLTEPTGYYALRTLVKYETNDAMRNLSGKRLTDAYSRYSIISSSPIHDRQFGRAFKLFIPAKVVYGNPASGCGLVPVDVLRGIHFNIRTFDQKFGDPNRSRFQNNLVSIGAQAQYTREVVRPVEFASAYPHYNTADSMRRELSKQVYYDELLSRMSYDELKALLISILMQLENRGGM